jgi:Predicted glycosyltransferases
MDVTLIIPNYNGEQYILQCLESVYHEVDNPKNIIVIDNGSYDSSVRLIQRHYPDITLVVNEKNVGFAAAVNQGIELSNTEYVILLNNDAFAHPGYVRELVKCIASDETIFSVSAKMLRYNEPDIIDDAGDQLTIFGWAYKVGDGRPSHAYNKPRTIISACAGAAIYRRKIFQYIGYFDERFFAYLEDVDIGVRANLAGYRNVYCPKAVVDHIGSAVSGSRHNEFKVHLAARNNVMLLAKNFNALWLILLFPFLIIGFATKCSYFLKKKLIRSYTNGLWEGIQILAQDRSRSTKWHLSKDIKDRHYWRTIKLMLRATVEYPLHKMMGSKHKS